MTNAWVWNAETGSYGAGSVVAVNVAGSVIETTFRTVAAWVAVRIHRKEA